MELGITVRRVEILFFNSHLICYELSGMTDQVECLFYLRNIPNVCNMKTSMKMT